MSSTAVWRTVAIMSALGALFFLVLFARSGDLVGLLFVVVLGACALGLNVHANIHTPFRKALGRGFYTPVTGRDLFNSRPKES